MMIAGSFTGASPWARCSEPTGVRMTIVGLIRFFLTSRKAFARVPSIVSDARVPLRLKIGALAVAVLIISPLNILGDIPLLGLFDDVALLGLLAGWFVRSAGRYTGTRNGDIASR